MMPIAGAELKAALSSTADVRIPDVVRPALQVFHTRPSVDPAPAAIPDDRQGRLYLFTDATVNIDPDNSDALARSP
ncbi:MAG: hypothetical protein U0521_06730 [Anaerolineae bacterium]